MSRKNLPVVLLALLAFASALRVDAAAQSSMPSGSLPEPNRSPQITFRLASDGTPIVPMIFPVLGKVHWIDSFAPNGEKGRRRHHGQDLMAPKMRPLVAAFGGQVFFGKAGPGGHNILTLRGDNGCSCTYMHINNDTPGTNDGLGSEEYAFPASLHSGDLVVAGQLIAFVGNSGNAEKAGPHCHFELWLNGRCINPAPSLRTAQVITAPRVSLPFPEIRPVAGEVRLDGVIRSLDPSSGVAIVSLASTTRSTGSSVSIVKPVRRWLNLKAATMEGPTEGVKLCTIADLVEGTTILVLGQEPAKDKALQVRRCKITLAYNTTASTQASDLSTTANQNRPLPFIPPTEPREETESFENFENGTFANWTLEGYCWQRGPATNAWFPDKIYGFEGRYFACTFDPQHGANETGKAISREFEIRYRYLSFLIGGGNYPRETCLNLVIDGRIAATATGNNSPELVAKRWDVTAYQGRKAHLEIVDASRSPQRGYILVDSIVFRQKLPRLPSAPSPEP